MKGTDRRDDDTHDGSVTPEAHGGSVTPEDRPATRTTAHAGRGDRKPSIEAKVGQLFHVGFEGTSPPDELEALIHDRGVGGVIYFDRNLRTPRQTRSLTRRLQDLALETELGLPLFVSVDQEGGIVRRLPYYTPTPGQMAVGATGTVDAAATIASITAEQLRSVGINWNLAPVLDVNSDPENPVIGVRAYGERPEAVAEFGTRYVEALHDAGVLSCGKHFPGHGATTVDSHVGLPVVDADRERLDRVETVPFRRAIDAGVDAIMTAHVAFPSITGSGSKPATLSSDVLDGYLRDRFGFEGLIVTDCLEMDAIADTVGTPQGAVEAIEAGADAVLVSHTVETQKRAIDAVLDAVDRGRIPESRIDEAFERIRSLKTGRDLIPSMEPPNVDRNRNRVRAIADRAVTLLCDRDDRLPLSADQPIRILALQPSYRSPVEDERSYVEPLSTELRAYGFDVSTVTVYREQYEEGSIEPPGPLDGQLVCCTTDVSHNPFQRELVESLLEAETDPIVAAVRTPYDVRRLPGVGTLLTSYDPTWANLEALAGVLAGEQRPEGTVPHSLR